MHWRRDRPPRAPTQDYISLLFFGRLHFSIFTFLYFFRPPVHFSTFFSMLYFTTFWPCHLFSLFWPCYYPWLMMMLKYNLTNLGQAGRQPHDIIFEELLMMMLKYNLVGQATCGRLAGRLLMILSRGQKTYYGVAPPLTVCVIIVLGMAMVLTDRCFWWW